MFEKMKKWFGKKDAEPTKEEKVNAEKPAAKKKPKEKEPPKLSEKELATQRGEPYINIVKMSVDPNDIHNGEFELDWNDKFILNLIRAGYKMREDEPDNVIVDRWFQTVCRNIALEMYEQRQADPDNRDLRVIRSRDIGDGRTEIS